MNKSYKFLIVASTFYPKITEGLLRGAIAELKKRKLHYNIQFETINTHTHTHILIII